MVIELYGLCHSLSRIDCCSANGSTLPILVTRTESFLVKQRQPAGLYSLPKDSYIKHKQAGKTLWDDKIENLKTLGLQEAAHNPWFLVPFQSELHHSSLCFCHHISFSVSCKDPCGEFPGSPVIRTPLFHCRGHGFDPLLGN